MDGHRTGGSGGTGTPYMGTTTKVRDTKRAQWLKMDGHGLSIRVHCTHQRLMNDAFGAVGA